ncbi:uncharacterized protein PHALS_01719 [Plasmopara halstedii]|uniref:Uncharacterized protein n=1 Tax=Plasmopara halstedii TaxID=4781 RepID=A0A0P1AVB7_PLAHL|nr:uncharacterized protein PHALS_01719 [Plasmopara halstedii]CEG45422.1 hypothetical protein PHALS_01719 [Plasmopara halstedii]|eukprot:XP_024581791.1 hypothetical protein PHALS_01719 [Plasmopara halstedii]
MAKIGRIYLDDEMGCQMVIEWGIKSSILFPPKTFLYSKQMSLGMNASLKFLFLLRKKLKAAEAIQNL